MQTVQPLIRRRVLICAFSFALKEIISQTDILNQFVLKKTKLFLSVSLKHIDFTFYNIPKQCNVKFCRIRTKTYCLFI